MNSATIKLFLPRGDAKSLRTAEISNWTGKAVAAPRTELDDLLRREELDKAGIYILSGTDPLSGLPLAYIAAHRALLIAPGHLEAHVVFGPRHPKNHPLAQIGQVAE